MRRPDAAITECQAIVDGSHNDRDYGMDNWERLVGSERVDELLRYIESLEAR